MQNGIKKFVSILMNIRIYITEIFCGEYSDKKRPWMSNEHSNDDSDQFRPLRRIKVYAIDRNIYDNQNR
jgi:hypothetical protein